MAGGARMPEALRNTLPPGVFNFFNSQASEPGWKGRLLKMKKILGVLLVLSLVVFVAGCGSSGTAEKNNTSQEAGSVSPVKLGIIQIAEHPSLDAAREGFLEVLAENGYEEGKNLVVEYHNAQGDIATANTIAQKLVGDQVDLVLAIATPAAQAIASATDEIPILITAVTDPVAAELVETLEKPNTNVTGTTDMNPVKEQLALVKEFVPEAQKVGIIYNTSEKNSEVQVNIAREVAPELGVELVEVAATSTNEVLQVAQSLVGKVDAIYVPTDNTVVSALASVVQVAEENDIPLIVGEGDSVRQGGLATIGIDYRKLGRQTGEMALRILEDGAKPQDMPIEAQKDYELIINKKAAANMGVEIPQRLLEKADKIFE
ncbi:ABC transporter substrate-binding protein [Calderihabitans maritimus]|uniref:ABC transporter substrate-binding protein n=2 Tax=Calderihabitans maritimus TaxID=1246530 RepID=A0A1Z5HR22_9FIRM|nr:ABC transporter substrate-binding protein [Calderihabitans maritimus]